jgi:hypothetical protein
MKQISISFLITILLILFYVPLITLEYELISKLIDEDGFYENLTALCYLISGCLLFILFFRIGLKGMGILTRIKKNVFYLLLGLFFIVCFGEEINWGQRILNIETPEKIQKINAQGEFNLHNIFIFHSYDKNREVKHGLEALITAPRLFAFFWLFYCVIIPIVSESISGIRIFFKKIRLPVIPVWIGLLFLLNYALSKISEVLVTFNDIQCIIEIKEAAFSFLFLTASVAIYLKDIKIRNQD